MFLFSSSVGDEDDDLQVFSRKKKKKKENDLTAEFKNVQSKGKVSCKVMMVGDGAVGKQTLIYTVAKGKFPEERSYYGRNENFTICRGIHVPEVGKIEVEHTLWHTPGQEDYDKLRPLSYPETHVFIICFSLVDMTSFDNVSEIWVPELRGERPAGTKFTDDCSWENIPVILVGTKLDLREDPKMLEDMKRKGEEGPVTSKMGKELSKKIGAFGYIETSSKQGRGLTDLFQEACYIRLFQNVITNPIKGTRKFKGKKIYVESDIPKSFLRKFIREEEKRRLEKLKDSIRSEQKLAREEGKVLLFDKLPRDVILYVLREFVLLEMKDVYYFRKGFEKLVSRIGIKRSEIGFCWYGYWSEMGKNKKRNVFQVFFSFALYAEKQIIFLPKLCQYWSCPKTVLSLKRKTTTSVQFHDFYSPSKIGISTLAVTGYDQLGEWVSKYPKTKQLKKLAIDFIQYSNSFVVSPINKFQSLESLSLSYDGYVGIYFGRAVCFKLPSLRILSLQNAFVRSNLSFKWLNLVDLTLQGNDGTQLKQPQFEELCKMKQLKRLRIVNGKLDWKQKNVDNPTNHFVELLNLKSLLFLDLNHVSFDLCILKDIIFGERNLEVLNLFVIVEKYSTYSFPLQFEKNLTQFCIKRKKEFRYSVKADTSRIISWKGQKDSILQVSVSVE